ncbi:TPR-like protein [Peniophora sp. CONT]|nr:TPR-like protein [Peniophora sp. CONT]
MWNAYRHGNSADPSTLDEAIQATQNAVDAEPNLSNHTHLLCNLGDRLRVRFELTKQGEDLDRAVTAFQSAVELTPDGDSGQVRCLNQLGTSLLERFYRKGGRDDLDGATLMFCCVVELILDNDSSKPGALNNYGISLLERFERIGDLEDLEQSIVVHRLAVRLAPDEPGWFGNLGNALLARFKRNDERGALEVAIAVQRRAVKLAAKDHPGRPVWIGNLGDSLLARFERTGKLEDLEDAISDHRSAVELLKDGHINKPVWFSRLGSSLLARYRRTGELDDLELAISSHRRAVELIPDGHPDKPRRYSSLGSSFLARFERFGELDDIEQAIATLHRAVDLTPDGHPVKPSLIGNLGIVLLTRFERLGELSDLEQAIAAHHRAVELTPDDHPDKPRRYSSLGSSIFARFERFGELGDIEQAIAALHGAVDLTPDGHPVKPSLIGNLGIVLLTRFARLGELGDLEQAIAAHHRAVELTPDDHPDKPRQYSNLGSSFLARFEHLGELDDLEQAISSHRRAVELTPDSHPGKPVRLSSLGDALIARSQLTGKLEDIEQAILAHRRAVEFTPDGHPDKPRRFGSLGSSLLARFERLGELEDIEQAIVAHRCAVERMPDGHPDKPRRFSDLGSSFLARFERCGELEDIERAILAHQRAVELTPYGHPSLSLRHRSLGVALRALFKRSPTRLTFDAAVQAFAHSTQEPLGIPSVRLDSARHCLELLSIYPEFSSAEDLISVQSRIIVILPDLIWHGHSIHRRFEESSKLIELVSAGVSAAIGAGALRHAIEWFEAGRALIWSQTLALRMPQDELQGQHPELAKSLQEIQQGLWHSNYGSGGLESHGDGGVDDAARHRQLAIQYDSILKRIRGSPGFEDFLRPKRFEALVPSHDLLSGPVAFINVDKMRCDALILSPAGTVTSVALPDLSLKRASTLRSLWTTQLTMKDARAVISRREEPGRNLEILPRILGCLWRWVVSPVLKALDLLHPHIERLPCITWCPTGPLTQLPLHAAGVYRKPDDLRAFDVVVSSYTPSLSALLRSCEGLAKHRPTPRVLILAQPATPGYSPLPGVKTETHQLQASLSDAHVEIERLEDTNATVGVVRDAINHYSWVHLACHGTQQSIDATQSAFMLFDGPLSLADLMATAAEDAELAFLSACQTATGDEKNPEESMHLAAGMLAVGFKGVVATMWSIRDEDAPIVVEAYYKKLLELRSSGAVERGQTGAAYALHEATRVLRERVGEREIARWAGFVHFGV